MKKLVLFICTVVLVFMGSCKFNKMAHDPGVSVNDELLSKKINSWKNLSKKNYSYTYYYKGAFENYKLDVSIEDGKVVGYVLKEYCGKVKGLVSDSEWNKCEEIFDTSFEDKNLFLIDNVLDDFSLIVADAKKNYENNSDSYYAKIEFTYSDDVPYILTCKSESCIMDNDSDGGHSVEICISNFMDE